MKKAVSSYRKQVLKNKPESGAAALEYIIISVFGLILTAASISLVGRVVNEKLADYEEELGIELSIPTIDLND